MTTYRDPHDVSSGVMLGGYMSVDAAVEYSGYNAQYFRRLMRKGAIQGVKVGQIWLVSIESLDAYLERIRASDDRRYGPRVYHEYVREQ
jgi:excisionase family DNA binding protein